MGGKFSRNKGRREEQQLVLYLAYLGYHAERILRQYQEAGQPDVIATKHGESITFEKKARKCSFATIYSLFDNHKDDNHVLAFVKTPLGEAVSISTRFPALLDPDLTYRDLSKFPPSPKDIKVFDRIIRLKEMKQSADYLVIKDNNRPQLFIKYR